jgi:hypothetical protein
MSERSRVVAAVTALARGAAASWRQLGEIDRWLDRHRTAPDREYPRAAAVFDDWWLAKLIARFSLRNAVDGSRAAAAAGDARNRFLSLERWQQVRLIGIAATIALAVHGSMYAFLPSRFAPRLPAIVWIGAAALGITLMLASRAVAAAWDARRE